MEGPKYLKEGNIGGGVISVTDTSLGGKN
jgi:hypothetical protein